MDCQPECAAIWVKSQRVVNGSCLSIVGARCLRFWRSTPAGIGYGVGPEVPVQTIEVTDPAIEAIPETEREVIGEKVSYRLAQQPGSYVVLKYVRKVVKRRDTQTILTAAAPANVLERSAADVSFLAAMLVDKFCWHLPVYRQHQRLLDAGITLSRSTLLHWASRAIDLLAPVTAAQSAHVLASDVLAMDETRARSLKVY